MVDFGAWTTDAPSDAVILGVRAVQAHYTPLAHTHVYFAHAFKGQPGANELMSRFLCGG